MEKCHLQWGIARFAYQIWNWNRFYVSKLTYNLFSVSKLTKDMNCVVTFFSSHGEFHDHSLGKMIGIAKRKDGLYYFSGVGDSGRVKSQNKMFTSVVSHSDIMLWHHCLRHPSFSYMKVLYPNLFVNKEKVSFQCEYCVLLNNPESIIRHIHTNPQNLFNWFIVIFRVHPERLI